MSRGKFLTACFVHSYVMDGRQLLVGTIGRGSEYAIVATFILPALVEQSLEVTLQNRMLRKCMAEAKDQTAEEENLLASSI